MPGMSGREFLERLGRDRPDLVPRVVLSTGDTFAPDTAALLKESGVPTVTKPFDFAMLERGLREVATRAAAGRPQAAGWRPLPLAGPAPPARLARRRGGKRLTGLRPGAA